MRVPDYAEALTGYRVWKAHSNGLLCGRHQTEPWPVKQAMVARCGQATRAHLSNKGQWKTPPVKGCACGVYAYTTLEQALLEQTTGFNSWYWDMDTAIVWGAVKLWGRVLEHERGYRAEFAYPASLTTDDEALVTPLQVYGVPVVYEPKPAPEPQPALEDAWGSIPSVFSFWRNASSKPLGVVHSVWADAFRDAQDGDLELVWTPPEEQRSPIEVPEEKREREAIRLWRSIAHGR